MLIKKNFHRSFKKAYSFEEIEDIHLFQNFSPAYIIPFDLLPAHRALELVPQGRIYEMKDKIEKIILLKTFLDLIMLIDKRSE